MFVGTHSFPPGSDMARADRLLVAIGLLLADATCSAGGVELEQIRQVSEAQVRAQREADRAAAPATTNYPTNPEIARPFKRQTPTAPTGTTGAKIPRISVGGETPPARQCEPTL